MQSRVGRDAKRMRHSRPDGPAMAHSHDMAPPMPQRQGREVRTIAPRPRQNGAINIFADAAARDIARWYHHPGSNGGPLDPQSSALTN